MASSSAGYGGGPDNETREILGRLADELIVASNQLEDLSETLCSDVHVVRNHIAALQLLDSVAQRQTAIAEIIKSAEIVAAARANTLEAIVTRLA